ncbi:MAG: MCE family protein [Deltaproteobacteria bacterium]|nr:MCE family protein [Deltaproteobacteria bacterium]
MAKQASKTVIGVFVVSSIAMLIAGVIIFGSGEMFKKTNKYVMFFEDSVKGLSVGAPVIWHGVAVGSVSSIVLKANAKNLTIDVPVVIEVDPQRVEVEEGKSKDLREQIELMIKKGLRARLALQSLLTGSSMVEVEFLPDTPVRLTGLDSRYPEIPTVKSPMDRLAQKLQDLPIEKIAGKLADILDNLDTVIADPEIKEMVHNLNVASKKLDHLLENADKLVLNADNQVKDLTDNLNNKVNNLSDGMQTTMGDARKLLQDVDSEVKPLSRKIQTALVSARVALDKANNALSSVDGFVGERSNTRHKLNRALDEIGAAAKSLNSLMDYLERHPEALLQGKGGRGR